MVTEEIRSAVRVGPDGNLKSIGFEPGTLVKTEPLGGNRIRETYVSGAQMAPKDIPILKEVSAKYGGDMSKPEAQKEFFKRAKHWRRKMNQRLNKPEPEPEKVSPPSVSLARRFQLAVCRLASGAFAQLGERDLQDCAILGSLQPDQRTFETFKRFIEALESGE